MTFPHSLPKPPPKAPPPPIRPSAVLPPPSHASAATPAPLSRPSLAGPASRPATPAGPGPGMATLGLGGTPLQAVRATPTVDTRGLPPVLTPLIEAMKAYDELLTEENAMLKAGDAKGVATLLDRKMTATRLYQERLRSVLADPQSTRSLSQEQRASVVNLVKCFEERAKENTILLKANMGAVEQLFEVINTAARKMRRQEVAYSKAGTVCDTYSRNGVSLAYNSTI